MNSMSDRSYGMVLVWGRIRLWLVWTKCNGFSYTWIDIVSLEAFTDMFHWCSLDPRSCPVEWYTFLESGRTVVSPQYAYFWLWLYHGFKNWLTRSRFWFRTLIIIFVVQLRPKREHRHIHKYKLWLELGHIDDYERLKPESRERKPICKPMVLPESKISIQRTHNCSPRFQKSVPLHGTGTRVQWAPMEHVSERLKWCNVDSSI